MTALQGDNTIVAVSTPRGVGGIAVVRMSGPDSLAVLARAWKGADVNSFASHTLHLGWILDSDGKEIDQVVVGIYLAPNSYTGEDVIEISCHGSLWIQQAIVNRLVECGAQPATAGEFTRRAFMNRRIDLAQADGIADMIAATSGAAARLASRQLKGDFSRKLEEIRKQLLDLRLLLELELDFSEEDVEFAKRDKLLDSARQLQGVITRLAESHKAGNAFKNGIPVAIAGVPNVGKSTLLNALLGEERAIVSEIAGTTRDAIEDCLRIGGLEFRLIDTAGLRETTDEIERIGVTKAVNKISDAYIAVCLLDPTQDLEMQKQVISDALKDSEAKRLYVYTKQDICDIHPSENELTISAKEGKGIDELKSSLAKLATQEFNPEEELIITNARHYEALKKAQAPLETLIDGLQNGLSPDMLAEDLREIDYHLSTITGAVTSDEILHTIFARYCIGK